MNGRHSLTNLEIKDSLQEAQIAANNNNAWATIEGIFHSMLLEAYQGSFKNRYPEVDAEDIYDEIGKSVDELFERINKGEKIRAVETYLWKIIDRNLVDFDRKRKFLKRIDGERFDIKDRPTSTNSEGIAIFRENVITKAESLIPRLGLLNVQEVMKYILGAIRDGVQDLKSNEIAEALHMTPGNVRVSMKRGFERLSRIFKEENLIDESFSFPFIDEMESYLDIIQDDNDSNDNIEY